MSKKRAMVIYVSINIALGAFVIGGYASLCLLGTRLRFGHLPSGALKAIAKESALHFGDSLVIFAAGMGHRLFRHGYNEANGKWFYPAKEHEYISETGECFNPETGENYKFAGEFDPDKLNFYDYENRRYCNPTNGEVYIPRCKGLFHGKQLFIGAPLLLYFVARAFRGIAETASPGCTLALMQRIWGAFRR